MVDAPQEQAVGMQFAIEHVQLDFISDIGQNIVVLQVQSNTLCFGLRTGQIFLVDLDKPSKVYTCRVPFVVSHDVSETLLNVWLNKEASHFIVKTNHARYYICTVHDVMNDKISINAGSAVVESRQNNLFISLSKLHKKNYNVTAVTWLAANSILMGTSKGQLLHLTIDYRKKDSSLTKLEEFPASIDGIHWSKHTNSYIIAAGSQLMFWHVKDADLLYMFNHRREPLQIEQFESLKKRATKKFTSCGSQFGWLTATGIVFGDTNFSGKDVKVLSEAKILLNIELPSVHHHIQDIQLSPYHILILRGNLITVVNQLNNEVAFEQTIQKQEGENIIGLTADYSRRSATYWCYSNSSIYEIILENESQAVWKMLCDQGKYDAALSLNDIKDWQKDIILSEKASKLLVDDQLVEAARTFGLTSFQSTESVAIALMNKEKNMNALIIFLTTKLENILSSQGKGVPALLLSSWIVYCYMKQLNELDEKKLAEGDPVKLQVVENETGNVVDSLKQYLDTYSDILDKGTVYQLLQKYNRKSESLYFANKIKDYTYIVGVWVEAQNWYEALKTLLLVDDVKLVYKYASILLVNSPYFTINTWMKIKMIDPVALIPTILTYYTKHQQKCQLEKKDSENFALTYLAWFISSYRPREPIIYNTSLYMLIASWNGHTIEDKTIKFLDEFEGLYDTDFILRLSLKFKRIHVAIALQSQLGLYEDAVSLALQEHDVGSAKLVVSSLSSDFPDKRLMKKLWLRIARNELILNNSDAKSIKKTIRGIIAESKNILEIKDLLPLFEDCTTVANIKDELIRSLEKHGQSMTRISDDIQKSLQLKKDIRHEIEIFNERYQALEPGIACNGCKQLLQTRKFFVFPCGHCFHTDCLIKLLLSSNDFNLKSKIENFQRKLVKDKNSVSIEELESVLAAKCCLCSDINVNMITDPIDLDEKESLEWAI